MCLSFELSIFAGIVNLFSGIYIYYAKNNKIQGCFITSLSFVQFYDALIWLDLYQREKSSNPFYICTNINIMLTQYFLPFSLITIIWVFPIFYKRYKPYTLIISFYICKFFMKHNCTIAYENSLLWGGKEIPLHFRFSYLLCLFLTYAGPSYRSMFIIFSFFFVYAMYTPTFGSNWCFFSFVWALWNVFY
jgi:hypothetical protein